MNTIHVGDNIKRIRKTQRLSVAELAGMIAVNRNTIYGYQNGEFIPSLPVFLSLCEALGCTPNDLVYEFIVEEVVEIEF